MPINYSTVLTRALLAGLTVGVLLAGYMFLVVEPVIDQAVQLEEELASTDTGTDASHAHGDGDELFSRDAQVGGGLAASVLYALIVAVIFGTVFAAVRHRLSGRNDFMLSVWLAAVGFGTTALMPAIKYPANPPAVGDPETVNQRTVQFLAIIVLSLLMAWAITQLSRAIRVRFDDPTRILIVGATVVVAYGLMLAFLPATPDAIAPEVPAALIWDFRIRSVGGLALLWAGLGFGFGWLIQRASANQMDNRGTTVRV